MPSVQGLQDTRDLPSLTCKGQTNEVKEGNAGHWSGLGRVVEDLGGANVKATISFGPATQRVICFMKDQYDLYMLCPNATGYLTSHCCKKIRMKIERKRSF